MRVLTQNSKLKTQSYNSKVKSKNREINTNGSISDIQRIKICSKCLKRAKKFGEVKATEDSILKNSRITVVDWRKLAEEKASKAERTQIGKKLKAQSSKLKTAIKKLKVGKGKKEEKKKEISVEELVGRNKSSKKK
jgi:hypothetical protein